MCLGLKAANKTSNPNDNHNKVFPWTTVLQNCHYSVKYDIII